MRTDMFLNRLNSPKYRSDMFTLLVPRRKIQSFLRALLPCGVRGALQKSLRETLQESSMIPWKQPNLDAALHYHIVVCTPQVGGLNSLELWHMRLTVLTAQTVYSLCFRL